MARKVKLATFDIDLRASVNKYPVSDSGDHIKVVKGGEGHFMPKFDNTSFIEFPRKFLFLTIGYEKVYFARKASKKCVDFQTETVSGPDPELVKIAAGATMLKDLGKEKQDTSMIQWVTLAGVIFIILNLLGVI